MDCTSRAKGKLQPLTTIPQVIIGVFTCYWMERSIPSLKSGLIFYHQDVAAWLNSFNCTPTKVEINSLGKTYVPQVDGRIPGILQFNELKVISVCGD